MADQINNELVSGGEYSLFRDDILKRIRSAQYEALRAAFFLCALSCALARLIATIVQTECRVKLA